LRQSADGGKVRLEIYDLRCGMGPETLGKATRSSVPNPPVGWDIRFP
jgi:hypothetical protein